MLLFPTPAMTPAQAAGVYLAPQFVLGGCGDQATDNPTYVTVYQPGAFKRVWVNYYIKNVTQLTEYSIIHWEFERSFTDPGPYTFQLQGSQSGTPRGDDWFNIGDPTTNSFALDDGGTKKQRLFGKTRTLVYRVLLTTPYGCYVSQIATVTGTLNKHDWLIVREILRKEQLSHSIFSSEKGYLLKARRYGPECADCRSRDVNAAFTDEIVNTNCPTCYGTGFEAGYYPATEYYALIMPNTTREYRDGQTGTSKKDVTKGRFLATLPLIQNDLWVSSGSDDRYYLHSITVAAQWKSVPIIYMAEMRVAPFTDAAYSVPLDI